MDEIVQKSVNPTIRIRRFVLEIPIFFLVVLFLDYQLNEQLTAWSFASDYAYPHPFWLGILTFGLLYGIAEGVTAGIVSSLLYVFLSPNIVGWNPLEWGGLLLLPASFVLIGVGVGVFHFFVMSRLWELSQKNSYLNKQVEHLDQLSKEITETNLELEKKIVLRMETFQTIYEVAETLNELDTNKLSQAIPALVAKHVKAKQCSFFLMAADENLYIQSMFGWTKRNLFQNRYSPDDALYASLLSHKETSVIEPDVLRSLNEDAFLVSALVSKEEKLIGMIKIEEIDFDEVSEESIKFFRLLSEWIMYSVKNAITYSKRRKQSLDEIEGIITEHDFWYHLQKVVNGALRHKYNVMMLIFSQKNKSHLSPEEQKKANMQIGRIIRGVCRLDDKIGVVTEHNNYQILVMLPFTKRDNIDLVLVKYKAALEVGTEMDAQLHDYYLNFDWELLSFDDGTLFVHDTVLGKLQNPI